MARGRVRVYRNSRTGGFSVLGGRGGRVESREEELWLSQVRFVVLPGGKARARETGVRNVHAFVEGVLGEKPELPDDGWESLRYHYMVDGGFRDGSGREWGEASWAHLVRGGVRARA